MQPRHRRYSRRGTLDSSVLISHITVNIPQLEVVEELVESLALSEPAAHPRRPQDVAALPVGLSASDEVPVLTTLICRVTSACGRSAPSSLMLEPAYSGYAEVKEVKRMTIVEASMLINGRRQ